MLCRLELIVISLDAQTDENTHDAPHQREGRREYLRLRRVFGKPCLNIGNERPNRNLEASSGISPDLYEQPFLWDLKGADQVTPEGDRFGW